ncbi:MAG: Gfo/Idh/MocA family protein [Planctomycetaceae bacterium]
MPFGFGIVGCGMISNFHAKALAQIPDAELAACFDMVPAAADRLAGEQGCRAYHDLNAMLADASVQVVTICTPSGAHLGPAVAAAEAGKHVLVEKPLEITLANCDAIIAACEGNGVKLGTIMPSRFGPANVAVKKAVDAGRFGKLTLGDTYVKWWRSQEYYDSGGWRGTWQLDGGGAFMNQAIHNVDLLSWFMGDVDVVCGLTATLAHERIEVEDVGTAIVRFRNGALGTLEAATSAYPGLLKKTEIHGTTGSVIVEQDDVLLWDFAEAAPEDDEVRRTFGGGSSTSGGAADPTAISFVGHQKQFEDFLQAIKNDAQPLVDGREGRKSVELILAIYQSSWTGQQVKLPLAGDPQRP